MFLIAHGVETVPAHLLVERLLFLLVEGVVAFVLELPERAHYRHRVYRAVELLVSAGLEPVAEEHYLRHVEEILVRDYELHQFTQLHIVYLVSRPAELREVYQLCREPSSCEPFSVEPCHLCECGGVGEMASKRVRCYLCLACHMESRQQFRACWPAPEDRLQRLRDLL